MAGGPSPFVNAFSNPSVGSLRYNTAQYGSPIFVCYGTSRISVNVIEGWGFTGDAAKGGKGFGSAGGKKGGGNYQVNVALALCEGPISFTGSAIGIFGNNKIWANGGVAAGLGNVSLAGYVGDIGQAPDPIFETTDPHAIVLGYSGTAYVTGTPMQLGSTPALPNIQFEICGFGKGTIGANLPNECNPAGIITDLLPNKRYGGGFPAANIDSVSLADYATYCQAAELGMSLLLDRQQPCARWLEEIADLTVSAVVWSGALLKIIPYSDQSFSANGATWNPVLTAQYSFGVADYIWPTDNSDPVTLSRTDPAQATNSLGVEYMDASNGYNTQVAPAWDQALIDQYGLRSEPSIQGHEFTSIEVATASATLQLQRRAYVRNVFKFKLGVRHSRLEPMDIVELSEPALGLDNFPVRITEINEDDDGTFAVTAQELPNNPFVARVRQPPLGDIIVDWLVDPGDANAPIMFQPPAALTGGVNELWFVSSGGSNWGGATVLVSLSGSTFAPAGTGTIFRGARQGVLTAILPSHADPDLVDTLSVDLTQSNGQLISGTQADADTNVTMCYCDGELVSYETATLTGTNKYDLTYLRRGAYGTPISSHSIGTQFARFGPTDPSVLRYPLPAGFVGQTISIKLLSFNLFGLELQDAADVSAYTFLLTGGGLVDPILDPLALGGAREDWGHETDTLIASADFGHATDAPARIIDLGHAA